MGVGISTDRRPRHHHPVLVGWLVRTHTQVCAALDGMGQIKNGAFGSEENGAIPSSSSSASSASSWATESAGILPSLLVYAA